MLFKNAWTRLVVSKLVILGIREIVCVQESITVIRAARGLAVVERVELFPPNEN